eukprot:CAMPEP_0197669602 /NCGR_PEP_ID=MMETSP1338-20131121/72408_1 /TAXON_ID=43686 ORGANISM="Pelagodinium beii, Strain RCC1491" /NCGR_SAMPLE_ID=MMETSP1338 /ASSEMBLY_ACC=CAM_ASM_000754 /LENGTH=38 /DNA_ID= /DNA_START= /DNA_END= /DNA_ORIENTATION=
MAYVCDGLRFNGRIMRSVSGGGQDGPCSCDDLGMHRGL